MSLPRRTTFLFALLLVGLAAVSTYVFPFRQIIAQRRAVELAERKLEVLREENRHLERRVEALHSPAEVERMAREQFGLVRPGEVAYVVVAPPEEFEEIDAGDDARPPDGQGPAPAEDAGPPTWWDRIWDFLTGQDLAPN